MWYKAFVPSPVLLIPVLIITTKGTHAPKNDTDSDPNVIVKYAEHAEAYQDSYKIPTTYKTTETTVTTTTENIRTSERDRYTSDYLSDNEATAESVAEEGPNPEDDVVFLPNDGELLRNEDYLVSNNVNLNDVMANRKTVVDVMAAKQTKLTTDSPNTDIIFVMGKNNENAEEPKTERTRKLYSDDRTINTSTASKKLNCSNLYCTNNMKSTCGGKMENGRWKFRLFLNECYFRKVNCNFRNALNRYKEVPIGHCKSIGRHSQKPFSFTPQSNNLGAKPVQVNNTKRVRKSSRRSMTMTVDGQFCSHPCPVSCTDHYAPECAVSATGRHRVFMNHCALDHNSCSFGVVWHKRPLSECVGGKKADVHQNAGFIGWMQRVGIVDKQGRMVLS